MRSFFHDEGHLAVMSSGPATPPAPVAIHPFLGRLLGRAPCIWFRWSVEHGLERISGNARAVIGIDLDRIHPTGIAWDEWIVPDDRAAVLESRRAALSSRGDGEVVYRALAADGSGLRRIREVYTFDAGPRGSAGALESVAFVEPNAEGVDGHPDLQDVDEKGLLQQALKRLVESQERLVRQEKLVAVGELVGGVAHELNNPLTSIIGFSELALRSCESTVTNGLLEGLADDVRCIHESALRCQRIVKNLLRFSRKNPPVLVPHDLNESMKLAHELLSYELATQNVKVLLELAPKLPFTLVDPHQMEMVLVNLINNAFHAIRSTAKQGVIVLRSRATESDVFLEVADTGPGIPPDIRLRIFDPFFTTKPVGEGTGLGLSLSHGIIAEHEGSIDVSSVVGSGATFTIQLPIRTARVESAPTPRTIRPPADGVAAPALDIVLIDDEAAVRDALARGLRAHGCSVTAAASEAELKTALAGREPDAILLDLWMPGVSGIEIFYRLQSDRPELRDRVVFISGDVASPAVDDIKRREGIPFLNKPLRASEVARCVRELVAARRAQPRSAA